GGAEDASSARDLVGAAAQRLAQLRHLDLSVAPLAEMAEAAGLQLEELGATLRSYRDGVEYDPERLAQVEERLGGVFALKRKNGGPGEGILALRGGARARAARLGGPRAGHHRPGGRRGVAAPGARQCQRRALCRAAPGGT